MRTKSADVVCAAGCILDLGLSANWKEGIQSFIDRSSALQPRAKYEPHIMITQYTSPSSLTKLHLSDGITVDCNSPSKIWTPSILQPRLLYQRPRNPVG